MSRLLPTLRKWARMHWSRRGEEIVAKYHAKVGGAFLLRNDMYHFNGRLWFVESGYPLPTSKRSPVNLRHSIFNPR